MHNNLELDRIIFKYLSNEISELEYNHLKKALQDDPDARKKFTDLREIWLATGNLQSNKDFDWESAFSKFENQTAAYNEMKNPTSGPIKKWMLAAASVAAALIIFFVSNYKDVEPAELVVIQSEVGIRKHVYLPDSTSVWLNGGTVLSYSPDYGKAIREVNLDGEAFFDVVKAPDCPFEVISGKHRVRVLGTRFNVCAFSNESLIETTLEEGIVKVYSVDGDWNCQLRPGEQSIYSKLSDKITKRETEVANLVSWKEGKLKFRDKELSLLVRDLKHWYGCDIVIVDPAIENMRFTGTVTDESLEELLTIFRMSNGIKYRINNGVYQLYQ